MFDFWSVYTSIKKYYPLGLDKEFILRFEYPGEKELEKIIADNIHEDKNNQWQWEGFCYKIEKGITKKIIGTTYGRAPCFSAYIQLEESKTDNLLRSKELHFFLSLTGPFYSIVGKDGSRIEFEKDYYHWVTNYLTVSPEKEYSDIFKFIESQIKEQFPEYRLVPFEILKQKIEGLYTKHYAENSMTIFNALFNDQIDPTSNISGNPWYGSDKWIREDYDTNKETGWIVYQNFPKE
jgi:hypothetical protein